MQGWLEVFEKMFLQSNNLLPLHLKNFFIFQPPLPPGSVCPAHMDRLEAADWDPRRNCCAATPSSACPAKVTQGTTRDTHPLSCLLSTTSSILLFPRHFLKSVSARFSPKLHSNLRKWRKKGKMHPCSHGYH